MVWIEKKKTGAYEKYGGMGQKYKVRIHEC